MEERNEGLGWAGGAEEFVIRVIRGGLIEEETQLIE